MICLVRLLADFLTSYLGKRYKTKKERMRIERDGPPLLPDGSLNYTESKRKALDLFMKIIDKYYHSGRSIFRAIFLRSGTTFETAIASPVSSIIPTSFPIKYRSSIYPIINNISTSKLHVCADNTSCWRLFIRHCFTS